MISLQDKRWNFYTRARKNRDRRQADEAIYSPVTLEQILSLSPEILISAAYSNKFVERTGASATTPTDVDGLVGTIQNLGTLGGYIIAGADSHRTRLRKTNDFYHFESDGVDDGLAASLAALRGCAGYTCITTSKDNSTSGARSIASVMVSSTAPRMQLRYGTNNPRPVGIIARRLSTDTASVINDTIRYNEVIVTTGIVDYTNTTGYLRVNGVEVARNTSFLTSGLSEDSEGTFGICALPATTRTNFLPGIIGTVLVFRSVLSETNLQLAERWSAEQMGLTL